MKLSEVLTGPETWCKGRLSRRLWDQKRRRPGPLQRCLMGGLTALDHSSYELMGDVIYDYTGARQGIAEFNDAEQTTWDDITHVVSEYDRRAMLAHSSTLTSNDHSL